MIQKVIFGLETHGALTASKMLLGTLVCQQLVDVGVLHVAFGADERLERLFYIGVVAARAEHVDTHDVIESRKRKTEIPLELS